MASHTTVNLLGPFEAIGARGQRLTVKSRRSRALLACLAIETGDSWTRPRLATLLWDNRSEQQGRSSLRQELVQLRKTLGVTKPGDWGDDSFVRLPQQIRTDVALLRAAIADGDATRVASAWRGELLQAAPATEGPFADWLRRARARLRQEARESLARALRAAHDPDPLPLEAVASTLAMLDPGSEAAHRVLIRCAMVRRDSTEVVERYRTYAAAADRHAGPTPAMKELLDEAIAAASGKGRPSTDHSTAWIAEINRQHRTAAAPPPTRPPPIDIGPALAVMPFVDLSRGAASREAFADGLTEEATTAMARVPGIFVTARQSSMVYKNTAVDARTVAAELGVRYLVEGSIEVRGRSIRVNARLVDGASGLHLWANNFSDELGEYFAVRNRIVAAVAAELQPALTAAEINRALDPGPNNLDAWTRLQRAHAQVLYHRDARGLLKAVTELKQALAIDPDYAMARALLAVVYTWRATWSSSPRTVKDRALALEHAAQARRADPKNSFVLVNCADTAFYSAGDSDLALELLGDAVKLNPYDPQGLVLLANVQRVNGSDPKEALNMIGRARRISPRDPRSHRWLHYAGWCHWRQGDLKAMEASARQAIELYSDAPAQWIELTCALGLQGKTAAAREAAKVLRKLSPTFTGEQFYEIARLFYGKRFTGEIRAGYRALREVLQRAI